MLRRAFISMSLALFVPSITKRTVKKAVIRDRVGSLGEMPLADLSRLVVYSETLTGKRINHKIEWYGSFSNGKTRHVQVCNTFVIPKGERIARTRYEIDGVLVGFDDLQDLKSGTHTRSSLFGAFDLNYRAPSAIKVNPLYFPFYAEVTKTIALYGTPTK